MSRSGTTGSSAVVRDYYAAYWSERADEKPVRVGGTLRTLYEQNVTAHDTCIDVGCGAGLANALWLERNASAYVGVDVAVNAIETAKRFGLDARLIKDASDLPFDDGSFDVAVCIEVLEHLFEPASAVREIQRILRPGGTLIATVPNIAHWRRRIDLALLGRWHPGGDALSVEKPWRDPHIRFFTTGALGRMLKEGGFADVRVGAIAEAFVTDIPGLRSFGRRPEAGPAFARLCQAQPAIFGRRIYASPSPQNGVCSDAITLGQRKIDNRG